METSSSTNSNRIGAFRLPKNFTPQSGMQETPQTLNAFRPRPRLSEPRLREMMLADFDEDLPVYCCGRQVISTRTGISFLTGMVNSVGGSILKSVSVAGIVPVI